MISTHGVFCSNLIFEYNKGNAEHIDYSNDLFILMRQLHEQLKSCCLGKPIFINNTQVHSLRRKYTFCIKNGW